MNVELDIIGQYQEGTKRSKIIKQGGIYIVDCHNQQGIVSRTRYLELEPAKKFAEEWVLDK